MTVFGCVTATISPTLSSYIRYKGKVWKTAFISSLQTVAGVEYSVYKKKGCWQIKGDWEKIKHAHRILTKVTTVDDWSAHLEREALRLEAEAVSAAASAAVAAVMPAPTPEPDPESDPLPQDDEEVKLEDQEELEDPSYVPSHGLSDSELDGTKPNHVLGTADLHDAAVCDIKIEPIDSGDGSDTTADTSLFSPTGIDVDPLVDTTMATRPGPPSPVHTPTTESSTTTPPGPQSPVHTPTTEIVAEEPPLVPASSGSRRKRGRPRKVETVRNDTDEGTASPVNVAKPAKRKKADDDEDWTMNFSDCNDDSDEEESEALDDPDFTIDKMVQEGKANLKTRPVGKLNQCEECPYRCKGKKNMWEHQQRQHEVKTLVCPICNKVYGVPRDLRKHVARHTAAFKCEHCGKTYKECRYYKLHLKTHEKDYVPTMFGCEHCDRSFTTKYVMMSHVEHVHRGVDAPEWLCIICGKKFKQKHSLIEHNLIHTGERPFVCRICSKTFRHKGSCVNHEFLHANIRLYTCEVCGKDFKHRNSLRIHASVHKDERQYACTFCDKKFTQKQALTRHMRIHSGEKPFKCELCDDRFNDNSILRRHMMGVHKTLLKSGKQHYVLPADQYEGTPHKNQQEGGLIDAQSTTQEESINPNLDGRSPIEEAVQQDKPPDPQTQQPRVHPVLSGTSTLMKYRQVASSVPSPFHLITDSNIIGGTRPSSIGGTGMLLPVVPVPDMDHGATNISESAKGVREYTSQYMAQQNLINHQDPQ